MSATSMADRSHVQSVIRRVTCPRCKAGPQQPCFSGRQHGGKYLKVVPNSHTGRWKLAIDSGHLPDQLSDLKPTS